MTRGALVPVALAGDFGKPRPALVIQSDVFPDTATVTLLMLTSEFVEMSLLRVTVERSPQSGLRRRSQIQIDKAMTAFRSKTFEPFGALEFALLLEAERRLALFFGIANESTGARGHMRGNSPRAVRRRVKRVRIRAARN